MLLGHPADHLGDEHRLAHAGAAEQADLPALHVGGQQIDDLDAGLEHLPLGLEGVERRGVPVDLPALVDPFDALGVEGLAQHVEHVPEHRLADGHADAPAGVVHRRTPHQTVGGLEADGPHLVVADLLGHLGSDHDVGAVEVERHLDGVVDLGQGIGRELHVDHRAGDGDHPAVLQLLLLGVVGLLGHGHGRSPRGGIGIGPVNSATWPRRHPRSH